MEEKYIINDICDVGSSKRIYLSEYQDSGIPFYRGKEIIEKDSNKEISNELFISQERYNEIKEKFGVPKKGDILMTAVGTIGISWYVNEEDFYFKDGNLIWFKNFKKDIVDSRYLYYIFKSKIFSEIIKNISIGSTQKAITIEQVKKIELEFPKIEIQNKIVKILDNISNKIKLNNEINNNLYDLGKSYFEDFISNCDREVAIKDIADEVLDYTKNKNDKVKLLNSSDVTENIFPKVEFVDNKDLKGHFKKRIKKHDILYSQIRPRNHHYGYVLLDDSENYLASTRFMVVRNKKEKVSSSLLYYYLTSKNAVEDFTTKTELRSGTFPQGNYEDLSSYVVKYSSNQESITKILDLILETINNNNNENEKLSQLRDTLLPKLMTGEIDLDNIEI